MSWTERRNAAIKREAAAVLSEITKRYGADVAKHLPRALPRKWTVGDPGPSANQRRATAQLKPDEMQLWVDACEALAGREVTFHHSMLDAMFGTLPADKLEALAGPPPDDVIVESIEESLPSDEPEPAPARARTREPEPPTPAPAAAKAPAEIDWGRIQANMQAASVLGPSAIRHEHSFDAEGRCSVCRHTCIHPIADWRDGTCGVCGHTPEACPHFYVKGVCRRCGRR